MKKQFFVSGIGTEIGKTYCSAMLVKALNADYWKPVQAGDLHDLESDKILDWSRTSGQIHPAKYLLNTPASPHLSAKIDEVNIGLEDFELPESDNHLVVEGAGGLLVPLNDSETILDLIERLNLPVVVVIKHYLGSINHSMLTLDMLKLRGISIAAVVFNGSSNESSEDFILKNIDPTIPILRMPELDWKDDVLVEQVALDWRGKILK